MTAGPDPLELLRETHRLERPDAARWSFRLGPLLVGLPNFAWRKAAIDAHDRHHLITGYPLTMAGEIQLAAWEWGAGRYPDWRATLFCSPLILAGMLALPRRTWRAYAAGRRSESLYPRKRPRRGKDSCAHHP